MKSLLHLLIAFYTPLFFLFSCQDTNKSNEQLNVLQAAKDSLTSELWEIHERGHINGVGVAILNQDGTLYANGIGYANTADSSRYSAETIQNIGSVSKTFIGISLMKAQEMGKLSLDDDVNQYLPFTVINPSYPEEKITLRHLATHTSSIVDNEQYEAKSYVLKDSVSGESYMIPSNFRASDSAIPLIPFLENYLSENGDWYQEDAYSENKPGAIYEYSNVAATLAAAVVEIATDTPFDEFTKEHILEPLGMNESGWSFDAVDMNMHSKLYGMEKEIPSYFLITYPDGGLLTSASDLSKYLSELIRGYMGNGALLQQESYTELFRKQLNAENYLERDEENWHDDEFNSGIFMGYTPIGLIGHTGGDPGIATYMFFKPETGIGRIMMVNTSIFNQDGSREFYAIWNTLESYETKLDSLSDKRKTRGE